MVRNEMIWCGYIVATTWEQLYATSDKKTYQVSYLVRDNQYTVLKRHNEVAGAADAATTSKKCHEVDSVLLN